MSASNITEEVHASPEEHLPVKMFLWEQLEITTFFVENLDHNNVFTEYLDLKTHFEETLDLTKHLCRAPAHHVTFGGKHGPHYTLCGTHGRRD
jgi:hypothetical protein